MTIMPFTSAQNNFLNENFDVLDPMTGATSKDFSCLPNCNVIVLTGDFDHPLINQINAQFIKFFEGRSACVHTVGPVGITVSTRAVAKYRSLPNLPIRHFKALEGEYYGKNVEGFVAYENQKWKLAKAIDTFETTSSENSQRFSTALNLLMQDGHLTIINGRICADTFAFECIGEHWQNSEDLDISCFHVVEEGSRLKGLEREIGSENVTTSYFNPYDKPGQAIRAACINNGPNIILLNEEHFLQNGRLLGSLMADNFTVKVLAPVKNTTPSSVDIALNPSFGVLYFNKGDGRYRCEIPRDHLHLFSQQIRDSAETTDSLVTLNPSDFVRMADHQLPAKFDNCTIRITCNDYESIAMFKLREYHPAQNPILEAIRMVNPDGAALMEEGLKVEIEAAAKTARSEVINRLLFPHNIGLLSLTHSNSLTCAFKVRNHQWGFELSSQGSFEFELSKQQVSLDVEDLFLSLRRQGKDRYKIEQGRSIVFTNRRGGFHFYSDPIEQSELEMILTSHLRHEDPQHPLPFGETARVNDIVKVTGNYELTLMHGRVADLFLKIHAVTDVELIVQDGGEGARRRQAEQNLVFVQQTIDAIANPGREAKRSRK